MKPQPRREESKFDLDFFIQEAAIANSLKFRSLPDNMPSANDQQYIEGACTGYLITKSTRAFSNNGALYEVIAFSDEYEDQEASREWDLPKITQWHTAFYMWLQPNGSVSFIRWQKPGQDLDVMNIVIDPSLNLNKVLATNQERVANYRGPFEFYRTMLQIEASSSFCQLADIIDSKLPAVNDFPSITGTCRGYNMVISERNVSHHGRLYEAIAFSNEYLDRSAVFDSEWMDTIETWHTEFYIWLQLTGEVSFVHWQKPEENLDTAKVIIDPNLNLNTILSSGELQIVSSYRK